MTSSYDAPAAPERCSACNTSLRILPTIGTQDWHNAVLSSGSVSSQPVCDVPADEFVRLPDDTVHTITDLELAIARDPALLAQMRDIRFTGLSSLCTLRYTLLWPDDPDKDAVLAVWSTLLPIIKSTPIHAPLRSVVIENPFPISILRSGWSQAFRCAALKNTLYHVDKRLVEIVDHGVLQSITINPQRTMGNIPLLQSQIFLDTEKARIRALFQALAAYDMLHFDITTN